jgi:hypothetical protein
MYVTSWCHKSWILCNVCQVTILRSFTNFVPCVCLWGEFIWPDTTLGITVQSFVELFPWIRWMENVHVSWRRLAELKHDLNIFGSNRKMSGFSSLPAVFQSSDRVTPWARFVTRLINLCSSIEGRDRVSHPFKHNLHRYCFVCYLPCFREANKFWTEYH